jgi:hypothetical protein
LGGLEKLVRGEDCCHQAQYDRADQRQTELHAQPVDALDSPAGDRFPGGIARQSRGNTHSGARERAHRGKADSS